MREELEFASDSKYLKVYGDGAIIFKLGFNEEIEKINNKILFINYDSIINIKI